MREELGDDPHTDAPRLPWTQRLRESLAVWADVRLLLIGVVMLGMSFAEGGANDWLALAVVDGHGYDATIGAADVPRLHRGHHRRPRARRSR